MCIYCHPDNEEVIDALQKQVDAPHFAKWNMTSLNHALIAVEGYNGDTAHDLALHLVERFYTWILRWNGQQFGVEEKKIIRDRIDSSIKRYEEDCKRRCTTGTEDDSKTDI